MIQPFLKALLLSIGLGSICFGAPSQPPQGITGFVYLQLGNRMPMKGRPKAGPGRGVSCEIIAYPPVKLAATSHKGMMITRIDSKPLATVHADSTGKFTLLMPEGRYTVLVKIAGVLYADKVNEQDDIATINILKGQLQKRNFVITQKGVY